MHSFLLLLSAHLPPRTCRDCGNSFIPTLLGCSPARHRIWFKANVRGRMHLLESSDLENPSSAWNCMSFFFDPTSKLTPATNSCLSRCWLQSFKTTANNSVVHPAIFFEGSQFLFEGGCLRQSQFEQPQITQLSSAWYQALISECLVHWLVSWSC